MAFSTRCMTSEDWSILAIEFGAAYFSPSEFKEPHRMGYEFMRLLFQIRMDAGVPMRPTSSYRAPWYNRLIGGAKDSAHMDEPICDAIDIGCKSNEDRYHIVGAFYKNGCTRIGIYKNGSLHLDRTEGRRPANRLWTVIK